MAYDPIIVDPPNSRLGDTPRAAMVKVNAMTDEIYTRVIALEAAVPDAASETVSGILELATQAEVTTGTDDLRAVTPLKLAVALQSLTVAAASETVSGILELATQDEVTTGTDDLRAVTPLKLAVALQSDQSILVNQVFS